MARLIVREGAESELDQIVANIARENLSAAIRFYDHAQATFELIATWPSSGTRRRVRDKALQGLHVIHGARDIDCAPRE